MRIPDEKRQEILDLVSTGMGATKACALLNIDLRNFRRWCKDDAEYGQAYQEARQAGADALADQIQEIGKRAIDEPEIANGARVAIDAFKWLAAKIKPRTYGDRTEIVNTEDKPLSPQEIRERIAALQADLALAPLQDTESAPVENGDGVGNSTSPSSTHATPTRVLDQALTRAGPVH